jgi:hypothetical protein
MILPCIIVTRHEHTFRVPLILPCSVILMQRTRWNYAINIKYNHVCTGLNKSAVAWDLPQLSYSFSSSHDVIHGRAVTCLTMVSSVTLYCKVWGRAFPITSQHVAPAHETLRILHMCCIHVLDMILIIIIITGIPYGVFAFWYNFQMDKRLFSMRS